ncbi:single-stranded DNA-binding protein [Tundrisphaera sp. TA3]|uniref:single-stranded DNA-binding protein n=1 Tax=Tundrisphaera sp. TA3 TaxID=3435775 RepID=UPI003EB6D568
MANLNKVFLIGNLTRDPELRRLPSGVAVTDLALAINRSYQSKDGDRRDEVAYVDVTVWDRAAENCCQYLKKGRPVHVEGYLKMDSWDDKTTGKKQYKLKIQADRVQFLGGRDEAGGHDGGGEDEYSAPAPRRSAPDPRNLGNGPSRGGYNNAPAPARRPPAPPVDNDADDDDIPF